VGRLGGDRAGFKMGNTNWSISKESATSAAYHDPEGFSHATKVCAMKHCRHPRAGGAASLAHAGKPIDDHFGVRLRGLNRLDERKRGGCDDPVTGLHDCLLLCGRRAAPAWRKGSPDLPLSRFATLSRRRMTTGEQLGGLP